MNIKQKLKLSNVEEKYAFPIGRKTWQTLTVIALFHPFDWDLTAFINSQEIYIDDICKNIPLIDAEASIGKMVDWKEIDRLFKELSVY